MDGQLLNEKVKRNDSLLTTALSWPTESASWVKGIRSSLLCLYDRTAARSGAEIGLSCLRLSLSRDGSLGEFLLIPECPTEKTTGWASCVQGRNLNRVRMKVVHRPLV